jgi:hypothetical protein
MILWISASQVARITGSWLPIIYDVFMKLLQSFPCVFIYIFVFRVCLHTEASLPVFVLGLLGFTSSFSPVAFSR